jgi:hypothetical protein
MRRARVIAAALAVSLLLGPAAAGAATGVYGQVLQVYEREGAIPPCQFSGEQLQTALSGVDTYGAQYFADFTQAVQTAISARAGGACAVAGGAGAAAQPRTPVPPPPPITLTAATDSGIPLPLALLGAAVVASGLLAGLRLSRLSPARRD